MLSRSMTATMSGRAAAVRRLRRRTVSTSGRLYCMTNGCTTYMVIDSAAGIARCPVCQAVRRVN
jgi:hypothetical protein